MKITIVEIIIAIVIIILFVATGALIKNILKPAEECKQFEFIDKFEENPTTSGFIIYYSDGRVKEENWLPRCIKLKK